MKITNRSSPTTPVMVPAGPERRLGSPARSLLQLHRTHAEVGLGARPEPGGPLRPVELEDHPLALAQRPEDRAVERPGGEDVLRPVGVPHEDALARPRVVRLDHALHRRLLRLAAYHAARPPTYAGGLAERRIRVPRAAPPGPARAAAGPGRRGRRHRRPRRRAALRH